jgi:hypothetical protein
LVNKFPAACDKEFLYEMNKSLKSVTKNLKDINTETDFKISDMKFTDKRLQKLNEKVKRQRIKIYWEFN